MSEFKVIETQEQLNSIIQERIERAKESTRKEYEGFMSSEDVQKLKNSYQSQIDTLNTKATEDAAKYAEFDKQLADRDARIAQYERDSVKTKIAKEVGLSTDLIDRLNGDTEDAIRADAQSLVKIIGKNKIVVPMA